MFVALKDNLCLKGAERQIPWQEGGKKWRPPRKLYVLGLWMISDVKKTEHISETKVKIDMIKELYDCCCLSENIVPRRKQLTAQLQ